MIDWPFEPIDHYTFDADINLEVTKSFNPNRITECLFGNIGSECQQGIVISGSQTANRMHNHVFGKKHFKEKKRCHAHLMQQQPISTDWLADYFGLPPDFRSFVLFRPRMTECIITPHMRWTLDPLLDGLYLDIYAPLIYTKWDLNMHECIETVGTEPYAAGYMSPNAIAREQLCTSFSSFVGGCCAPIDTTVLFQPLHYAKMSKCALRTTRLAEISSYLWWDFRRNDHDRAGIALFGSAPTGTRPNGRYLFEPIAGNDHHWYAGAKIYGTVHAARDYECESYCTIHGELALSNIFSNHQHRTFDLKGKPNSRYMLIEKVGTPVDDMVAGNGITPNAQFKQVLAPLANISTCDIKVAIGAQFNINAFFAYTCRNLSWIFGYRYWTRRCDKISLRCPDDFPSGQWAVKGDSYLYGFVAQPGTLPLATPVALSATQSQATINAGNNLSLSGQPPVVAIGQRNPMIDNPQPATAGSNQILAASLTDLTTTNQINTSIQPRVITLCDLDLTSARTTGTVQTLFASAQGTWDYSERAAVLLGFGADIDFGKDGNPTQLISIDDCVNCAFSAWKLYAHASIVF